MAHVRKQLRDAVKTVLSVTPTNWQIVYAARWPPNRDVLPYLLVFTDNESSQADDISVGYLLERSPLLTVVGRVRLLDDGEAQEDSLDALAAEVETALTKATLGVELGAGKLKAFELISSDSQEGEEEYKRTFAEITLTWQVRIYTVEGVPETLD